MFSRFQKKEKKNQPTDTYSLTPQLTLSHRPVLQAVFSIVSIIIKQGTNSSLT